MTLAITEDHETMRRWLGAALAVDPVRGTVLGTIRAALREGAWAATDGAGSLAVRSTTGTPVVIDGPWPAAARSGLRPVLATLPGLRMLAGPPEIAEDVASEIPGPRHTVDQALFRLDELRAPRATPGRADTARADERDRLRRWMSAFVADIGEEERPRDTTLEDAVDRGHCWLWRDTQGVAVSMACRRPVFEGSARIGPVYTPPEHRGRGYGKAATAAATRDILDEGAIPVLFTDLANPTSNKIYAELGYYRVDERVTITFGRVRPATYAPALSTPGPATRPG